MEKKQLKIRVEVSCVFEHESYSGIGQYTRLLCEELSRQHKVEYTTGPFFNTAIFSERPSWFSTLLNKIYRKLASYRLPLPVYDLLMGKVDITIFPNFATLPAKKTSKSMCVIHDLTYIHYPKLVEKKNLSYLQRVVPQSMKRAYYIVTTSKVVKDEILDRFELKKDRFIITPIPPGSAYSKLSSIDVRKKYKIPTEKYVLFVGNLEPRKNITTLLRAYDALPNDIKASHSLVIAGKKGWEFDDTQKLMNHLMESNKNIVQVGYVDSSDMPALYQKASLFVFPSLYEGFGIPILESLSSGCPVLASDIPIFREVGGDVIRYADARNAKDFANKMKDLISADSHVKGDYRKHLSHFSWSDNVNSIVNIVAKN